MSSWESTCRTGGCGGTGVFCGCDEGGNLFAAAVHRHDIQGCSTGDQEDGHNDTARRTKMESSDAKDDFEEETEGDKQNGRSLHDLLTPLNLCRVAGALAPQVLTETNTALETREPTHMPSSAIAP